MGGRNILEKLFLFKGRNWAVRPKEEGENESRRKKRKKEERRERRKKRKEKKKKKGERREERVVWPRDRVREEEKNKEKGRVY